MHIRGLAVQQPCKLSAFIPWYRQGDSRPEFFQLMQETKPDIIKKLCVFINEILKIKDFEYAR